MGQVSTRVLQAPLCLAQSHGLDLVVLAQQTGHTPEYLANRDNYINHQALEAFWSLLESDFDPLNLGLLVADYIQPEDFDLIHFLGNSSETIGSALQLFSDNFSLVDSEACCEVTRNTVTTSARIQSALSSASLETFLVATIARGFRQIADEGFLPHKVSLTQLSPPNVCYFERYFGCKVDFADAENVIYFNSKDLLQAPRAPDAVLHALLSRQLDVLRERLPHSDTFLKQAQKYIQEELPSGLLSIESLADKMSQSKRTLQRRLAEEGYSFSQLLEETRQKMAYLYLSTPELSIPEVSSRLGYTQPRAFHRAFKQWQGQTPGNYRKALRGD